MAHASVLFSDPFRLRLCNIRGTVSKGTARTWRGCASAALERTIGKTLRLAQETFCCGHVEPAVLWPGVTYIPLVRNTWHSLNQELCAMTCYDYVS